MGQQDLRDKRESEGSCTIHAPCATITLLRDGERPLSAHTKKNKEKKKKSSQQWRIWALVRKLVILACFPPYTLKQEYIVIFLMPLRSGGFSSQEDMGFHRVGHCWGKAASHQIITTPPQKKKKKLQVLQAGFKKIGTNQTRTLGNAVPPWMAVA